MARVNTFMEDRATTSTQNTTKAPTTVDPYQQFLMDVAAGKYNAGGGSIGNYTGQAQNLLGGLDLSAFEQLRASLEQQHQTGNQNLNQSFDQLLSQLEKQQTQNRQEFSSARGTIMEDSFTRNRDLYRNLASRGLGASGLQQLGDIQNRMETGRQVSGVAGQFYDASDKIADTKQQGTIAKEQQRQQLDNSLQSNMAQLAQQEMSYRNDYQQRLASLALQLQDQASRNAQANLSMRMSAQGELAKLQSAELDAANPSEMAKIDIVSRDAPIESKAAMWADQFKVDINTARQQMASYQANYEQSLVNEMLEPFSARLASAERFSDVDNVLKVLKQNYENGALDKTDVESFLQKNYGNLNKPQLWEAQGNGLFSNIGAAMTNTFFLDSRRANIIDNMGGGLAQLFGSQNPNNNQQTFVKNVLDMYNIK